MLLGGHVDTDVRSSAEAAVGSDLDVLLLAESQELLHGVVGVQFDLQNGGLVLAVGEDVSQGGDADVAAPDVLDEPGVLERLHGLPGFLVWD